MNPVFDPLQRKMVSGPEAGQNVETVGFEVNFIGGGTDGTVYNAGSGLTLSGNVFEADVASVSGGLQLVGKVASVNPGYRINTSSGTVNVDRYMPIETVTGTSVTLQAGHAYKVYATTSAVTINTETIPENSFGLEGHIEIFVGSTGYVVAGANVVLATPLEPASVNNCTVRFHDGFAIISVEDHIAGYIVTLNGTSGVNTLNYALSSATQDYVTFTASLNGQTLDMAGAATNGEKHIVGNGYTETILTGAVNCGTSKFTVANLSLQNVVVSGGVMTFGDACIPSGSTVAVSGGGLAIEKVTGAGETSVIDFGGTNIVTRYVPAIVSNCQLKNGYIYPAYDLSYSITDCALTDFSTEQANVPAYAISNRGNAEFVRCLITGNTAYIGAVAAIHVGCSITLTGCTFSNNSATYARNAHDLNLQKGTATVADCSFTDAARNIYIESASCTFSGTNSFAGIVTGRTAGSLLIASGAIIDLTGNTYTEPITPGGGIMFEEGGATVYPSAGQASAYMLGGLTIPQVSNTNVVNLSGTSIFVDSGASATASGATFTSGVSAMYTSRGNIQLTSCTFNANSQAIHQTLGHVEADHCTFSNNTFSQGAACNCYLGTANYTDCIFASNTASVLGGGMQITGTTITLTGCTFSDNTSPANTNAEAIALTDDGNLTLSNCTFSTGQSIQTRNTTSITLVGTNVIGGKIVTRGNEGDSCNVEVSAGAVIDLNGNAGDENGVVINPGGGIAFGANVTVINSAGQSVLLNGGVAGTCSVIKKDGTTE